MVEDFPRLSGLLTISRGFVCPKSEFNVFTFL